MPRVRQQATARRDLIEHFVYLAEHADLDTAERFLTNAQISFEDLARQPGIGVALTLRSPELLGMRRWRIRDFDNHLILYMPRPDGVSIVRVLHAAQDWWTILGYDEGKT